MNIEKKLDRIREITIGKIEDMGFLLYHLEYVTEEGEKSLRFHIQHKDSSQVSLDDCEKVSRAISEIIDSEDPIDEPYYLEVQSAGDFRELFTNEHLNDVIGSRVLVMLSKKLKGSEKFNGLFLENREDSILIKTEKDEIEIKKDIIDSVSLKPEF